MTNADAKREAIDAYFDRWNTDLNKAEELIRGERFYLEGWLVLSCHIGAFASMRYPDKRDGEAYVATVIDYAGNAVFWRQIDLLFLYQWPRSKLRNNRKYASFPRYEEIVAAAQSNYGREEQLDIDNRFVEDTALIENVLATDIEGLDEIQFREWLPLFSLAEQLYRYVRCDAVHNLDFPLVNEVSVLDGGTRYESNHAITGDVIVHAANSILNNLRKQCATEAKWPHEL